MSNSTPRSSQPVVRYRLLKLPSAGKLAQLTPEAKAAWAALLRELRQDSKQQSEMCWKRPKAPMAAYWKAVSVYAEHINRILRMSNPPFGHPRRIKNIDEAWAATIEIQKHDLY